MSSIKLKPLDQKDYTPILLEDLGMQLPSPKVKRQKRYAMFECMHCSTPFKGVVSDVKKGSKLCCSAQCSHGLFLTLNQAIVPTTDFYAQAAEVYYIQEFKTKEDKVMLLSLNDLLNMYYKVRNNMKQYYNDIFMETIKAANYPQFPDKYEVAYVYYYRNDASDLTNVCTVISKFFLDAAQKAGLVMEDNVKVCRKESFIVGDKDIINPRVEIYIRAITKDSNE